MSDKMACCPGEGGARGFGPRRQFFGVEFVIAQDILDDGGLHERTIDHFHANARQIEVVDVAIIPENGEFVIQFVVVDVFL